VTGLGLFPLLYTKAGTVLGEYYGDISRLNDVDDRAYALSIGDGLIVNARRSDCSVKYVNHAHSSVANCVFIEVYADRRFYVVTKRAVRPGQEFLVDYGKEYWCDRQPLRRSGRLAKKPHQSS